MSSRAIKANWEAIRILIESGVPFREVSERFGIKEITIRQRGLREKWATPPSVRKRANELAKQPDAEIDANSRLDVAAAALLDQANRIGVHSMKLIESSVMPVKKMKINTIHDLKAAVQTSRIIAGLDKEQSSVNVSLAMFASGGDTWTAGPPPADLEATPVE